MRGGKLLVVITLVLATGAHWAVLQTVAWSTMLAGNLCTESVSQAVAKTFDGEHPCPLCKAIAAAKKAQKKSEAVSPVLKMEFPPVAERIILIPPPSLQFCRTTILSLILFRYPRPCRRRAAASLKSLPFV